MDKKSIGKIELVEAYCSFRKSYSIERSIKEVTRLRSKLFPFGSLHFGKWEHSMWVWKKDSCAKESKKRYHKRKIAEMVAQVKKILENVVLYDSGLLVQYFQRLD